MDVLRHEVAWVCSQLDCLSIYQQHTTASKFMIDTGAGVIDADYRGTVFVLLFNLSDQDFVGEFNA